MHARTTRDARTWLVRALCVGYRVLTRQTVREQTSGSAMPVIAMASTKGGCGKSTLTLILADAFVSEGLTVRIIDADPALRLVTWAKKGQHPEAISVVAATESTLSDEIERGRREAQVTLVDLEGSKNFNIVNSMSEADLTLIPANQSMLDVSDALLTVKDIRKLEKGSGRTLAFGVVWNRVPNFLSNDARQLAGMVEAAGVPIIGQIPDLTAYKALFSYDTTTSGLDPKTRSLGKAIDAGLDLAHAALTFIKKSRS